VRKTAYTVYDIARLAGVSPSTVSRVLTGNSRVSQEKEARIRSVIAELNFRPNAHARTLLARRSRTLGVLIPDLTNLFFSQTFLALETAALSQGYSLIVGNTLNLNNSPVSPLETYYVNSLLERQVDGLLYMGGRVNMVAPESLVVREMIALRETLPLVAINGRCEGTGIHEVSSDEGAGVENLVGHLFGLGHREFAFLGGYRGITSFDEKLDRAAAVIGSLGGRMFPEWILPTGYSLEAGALAMATLLERKTRPTAVLGVNDYVAMGAIRGAVERGMRVPQDLSVTGFDDVSTSRFILPSLTTVNHNYQALAEAAIGVMVDLLDSRTPASKTIVSVELKVRESTGPAASR
jgi:DNA-binding LacI/PurR family transcriptional regulator